MAQKTLQARLKLKYDTLANWTTNKTFVPLEGEMCIAYVPASSGAVAQEPAILFKVGDGTLDWEHLPWGSGLAADVYDWAKKSTLDWSDISASFKSSLESYINTQLPDTNTTYQLEVGTSTNAGKIRLNYKEKGEGSWTNGSWIEVGVDTTINDTEPAAVTGEISVLTDIAMDGSVRNQINTTRQSVYTKDKIDSLINPGMEFKGVLNLTALSALPANAKKGDSYKLSASSVSGYKAGDLVIAVKDNPSQTIDDTNWSVIPAGDEPEDTWRPVQVNGTQILGSGTSTGALNLKAGNNISITNTNGEVTITNSYTPSAVSLDAFTGATSSAAGQKGVVPAPAAGDDDAVLVGDGNWYDLLILNCGSSTVNVSSSD